MGITAQVLSFESLHGKTCPQQWEYIKAKLMMIPRMREFIILGGNEDVFVELMMAILLQLQSHLNIPSIGKADRVVTPSVEKPVYFELFTTTPFMANKDAGALCRAGRKGGMPSVSVNSQFRKQRRWTSTWASNFMIVLYIQYRTSRLYSSRR